jgi:uncharacterized protein (TIGR02301 family)
VTRQWRSLFLATAIFAAGSMAAIAQTAPTPTPPQQQDKGKDKDQDKDKPPPEPPPPPYEPQLLRLSEIMGSLAYLRDICGARDADAFHTKMTALLAVEGTTDARKERLAGAYNHGFQGYAMTYRVCTPAAHAVIARFLDEAAKISKDMASRYGG